MKYAINRGQRIAYEVFGRGPAVILQHGFLRRRQIWEEMGYVDVLTNEFTVITVDSLGHGQSDKPTVTVQYKREARVNDITAILDAEEIDKAHYVGYSMGSWMGMGLLRNQLDRLLSITLGGFDPTVNKVLHPDLTIDQCLDLARLTVPEAVAWVTPEMKPGLTGCLEAMKIQEIAVETLLESSLPVNLWVGREDTCFEALNNLHSQIRGSTFTDVPGDHTGAMVTSSRISASGIRNFLQKVSIKLSPAPNK